MRMLRCLDTKKHFSHCLEEGQNNTVLKDLIYPITFLYFNVYESFVQLTLNPKNVISEHCFKSFWWFKDKH